jgi:hypothetical protein
VPIGAISVGVISWHISAKYIAINAPENFEQTQLRCWVRLDWAGTSWRGLSCALAWCTLLLLPLRWGGNTKAWNDKDVIILFCIFGVVLVILIVWERKYGANALLPLALFRSQIGCCSSAFWVMLMLLTGIYYLPLFYQAKVLSHFVTFLCAPRNLTKMLVVAHDVLGTGTFRDEIWHRHPSVHAHDGGSCDVLWRHDCLEGTILVVACSLASCRHNRSRLVIYD